MIVLYILLGIIALIVALLSIRFTVTAKIEDGFYADVRWLFLHYQIFPRPKASEETPEGDMGTPEEQAPAIAQPAPDTTQETNEAPPQEATPGTSEPPPQGAEASPDTVSVVSEPQEEQQEEPQIASEPPATQEQASAPPAQDTPKEKTTTKPGKAKKKKASPSDEGLGFIEQLRTLEGLSGIVRLVLELLKIATGGFKKVLQAFVLREIDLRIVITGKDAAKTALNYGRICEFLYPALGRIYKAMHGKRHEIEIEPDYLANSGDAALRLVISVRPIRLIHAMIATGVKLLWKLVITKLTLNKKMKHRTEGEDS